ncbi:MAG: ArnT family glycosyltransferase [Myxococcota bacterium]
MSPTEPSAQSVSHPTSRDPLWWHVGLLLAASILYEWSFLHIGLNLLDEGWPLYVARRLHEGGELYRDAFFVFPPGHVLNAWLAYGWQPPGFLPMRVLDSAYVVSLVIAVYFVGRRLMPPVFACFGALLLALCTPYSHVAHFLFGYRYFVFATLGLLAFFQRVKTGDTRWTFLAGLCAGVGVSFRLTPAFALSVAVAFGALALDRSWRTWLREWSTYAIGVLLVAVPVVAWLGTTVGPETAWREIIVRPVVMTDLQSLEMPALELPKRWNRTSISYLWTSIQFRLYTLLYAGYLVAVFGLWLRALRRREPFEHVLLLTTVVWGATYWLRSFGRSDVAHLESAIPPVCILLAHLLWLVLRRWSERQRLGARDRGLVSAGAMLVLFSLWIFLFKTDVHFSERGRTIPIETLGGIRIKDGVAARQLDRRIRDVQRETQPGDTILDMSYAPGFYLATDRSGPGWFDVIMPGTFMSEEEERFFIEKLKQDPPALIIVLDRHFDDMPQRSLRKIGPIVTPWLLRRYAVRETIPDYNLAFPKDSLLRR